MKVLLQTIILMTLSFNIMASDSISCYSDRLNTEFKISKQAISIVAEDGRSIASVSARTKHLSQGFNKILNHENKKVTLHIQNKRSFSQVDDYITLRNQQGHEVTYPLECENI